LAIECLDMQSSSLALPIWQLFVIVGKLTPHRTRVSIWTDKI
jgi:hypothetical protein